MSRLRTFARNLTANWVRYVANAVVTWFMTPFVIIQLGDGVYGVWTVLMSLTGYLGLVELGTRAGLGRFVMYYIGQKNDEKVNGILSTAAGLFVLFGVVIIVGAGVLGATFGTLFPKIPAHLVGPARVAILLAAVNLWASIMRACFTQVLSAHERYDLLAVLDLSVLALRTGGVVAVLLSGYGIVALAAVHAGTTALGTVLTALLARRVYPALDIRPTRISRTRFRELFGFSIWAFVSSITAQILYTTDTLIIGILFASNMVTYYAIPLMLVVYARNLVGQVTQTLNPHVVKTCGAGDRDELRRIFRWGSKATTVLAVPMFLGLMFYGDEFMRLWMTTETFQHGVAARVMVLLAAGQLVVWPLSVGNSILLGLGHVRFTALMGLSQAMTNLALTLTFVMVFGLGLPGVALGTLVPIVVFNVAMAVFICRRIGVGLGGFARNVALPWGLDVVAVGALFAAGMLLPVASWPAFFAKTGGLAVAGLAIGFYLLLSAAERESIMARLRAIVSRRRAGSATAAERS